MSAIRIAAALSALALPFAAQSLTVPGGPHAPGSLVTATYTNETGGFLGFPLGCEARTLRHSGDVVAPFALPGSLCDIFVGLSPKESTAFELTAPTKAGSYVVFFPHGPGAVARFDVTAGDPDARDIVSFPWGAKWPQSAHAIDYAPLSVTTWAFGNTGRADHEFVSGDRIDLFLPGGTTAVASLDLAGLAMGPGEVLQVTLPVAGLPSGPYDLEATWFDADTASMAVERSGIRDIGSRANLHLPDGDDLASGASIDIAMTVEGFPTPVGSDPTYAILVCLAAGSTPLADGTVAPLVQDGLADLSLSGLGGLLQGHVGTLEAVGSFPSYLGEAVGMSLTHPNIPGLAGLQVRVAGIAVDETFTTWAATQPETIELQ